MKEDVEIHQKIGKILTESVSVENLLELFIINYFIEPSDDLSAFFEKIVIQPLSFANKIDIFRQICTKSKFPEGKIKETVKIIEEVKSIRNKVAHSETVLNLSTGRKHIVKRLELAEPSTDLNDEFMNKFNSKIESALSQIADFWFQLGQKPFS